ncbi:unnamed protein product [Prunus armeniaca]
MIGASGKRHVASSCWFLSTLTSTVMSCYINNLQATTQAILALGLAQVGGSHPLPKLPLRAGGVFWARSPLLPAFPPCL